MGEGPPFPSPIPLEVGSSSLSLRIRHLDPAKRFRECSELPQRGTGPDVAGEAYNTPRPLSWIKGHSAENDCLCILMFKSALDGNNFASSLCDTNGPNKIGTKRQNYWNTGTFVEEFSIRLCRSVFRIICIFPGPFANSHFFE